MAPDPKNPPSIVGLNLRRLRKARGLKQQGLADLGGFHRVYITRVENGSVQQPDTETIDRLADALGVKPEMLTRPEFLDLPIAPLVEEFRHSDLAKAIAPTDEEYDYLLGLRDLRALDMAPSIYALFHLIKARRGEL